MARPDKQYLLEQFKLMSRDYRSECAGERIMEAGTKRKPAGKKSPESDLK